MKSATFSVDAALVRELGERLIGHSYIALAELVKNSYDADSTECQISFVDDEITVTDNGHGISEREFHHHWLRIGTTHKYEQRESRSLCRPMTGSKGVGRLSVQFLAHRTVVESVAATDPDRCLYASIDWTKVQEGQDLNTVEVRWEMRRNQLFRRGRTGTRITLKSLQTEWTSRSLENLGQELWMLRPPSLASLPAKRGGTALDFDVAIVAPGIKDARSAFDKMHMALWRNVKARIIGRLEDGRHRGNAHVEVEFANDYPEGQTKRHRYQQVVPMPIVKRRNGSTEPPVRALDRATFEIMIFNTRGHQKGIPVGQMRDYLRRFGNVSVYDSGFRLPYYGARQDWLNIARDQGRRLMVSDLLPESLHVQGRYLLDLPAPARIFGYVEVNTNHEREAAESSGAAPGTFLLLSSGRDRLAENSGFEQLNHLVRLSLDFYASRYRLLASRQLSQALVNEKPSRSFSRALSVLEKNEDVIPAPVYTDVRRELLAATRASKRAEENINRRAALLAPLATAGMTALALNHEFTREILILERNAALLADVAATSDGADEVSEMAIRLRESGRRFRALQGLFLPLESEEDRESSGRLLVENVLNIVVRGMSPIMKGVQFQIKVPPTLRFPVGSMAEWSAIVQNLLSNAWNAMLSSDEQPQVSCDGGRRGHREWLRVSDTGVGLAVSLDRSSVLFRPFERHLQIEKWHRSIAVGGQGLGLAIVKMIALQRGAEVAFVEPQPGFSTSIELSWKGAPQ